MQHTTAMGGPFAVRRLWHGGWALLACVGALLLVAPQCQAQEIQVNVNGQPVSFEGMGPLMINGRVLVPIRGVLENLGADVGWNQETQTAFASNNGVDIRLRIGDHRALVNGRPVFLDTPAREIAGHTMVPLRFLSEALGAEVNWHSDTDTVDIRTHGNGINRRFYRGRDQRSHDEHYDNGLPQ